MPSALDQPSVMTVLKPIQDTLANIIISEWDRYKQFMFQYGASRPRTQANVVWDWVVTKAKEMFEGAEGMRCIEMGQTTWFMKDQSVIFRIKKAGRDGFSRNFPTQSALAYHEQNNELDGMPQIARVDIVYILDKAETRIEDIRVVCRNGERIMWQESILPAVIDNTVHIVPAPNATPPKPPAVTLKDTAVVKDSEQEDKG